MRDILYRGKRVDNGEWVEGLLWKNKYDTSKLFMSYFPDKDDNEAVALIDPETVGQYTGLVDKNGKKIFEGDIVSTDFILYGEKVNCIVEYEEDSAGFVLSPICDFNRGIPIVEWGDVEEIIGNETDNPELLQED